MKKLTKSRALALFYIVFGIVLVYLSSQIKYMFSVVEGDVGPKAFPTCIGIGIILCGIGKFFSRQAKEDKPFMKDWKGYLRLVAMFALFVAYILGLKYLGYIISTIAFAAVLLKMLSSEQKLAWWKILIFAVVVTLFSYFCFEKLIKVILPQGKWTRMVIRALR